MKFFCVDSIVKIERHPKARRDQNSGLWTCAFMGLGLCADHRPWPKSDSKVTLGDPPQSDPKWLKATRKWLENGVRSHFWVIFGSLWGRSAQVTSESLWGHFNSAVFCIVRRTPPFITLGFLVFSKTPTGPSDPQSPKTSPATQTNFKNPEIFENPQK